MPHIRIHPRFKREACSHGKERFEVRTPKRTGIAGMPLPTALVGDGGRAKFGLREVPNGTSAGGNDALAHRFECVVEGVEGVDGDPGAWSGEM